MSDRRGLDRFELGVLALFAALSLWVAVSDLVTAHAHGLHWTGTDGFYSGDQLQYLAWIQSSARHWLVSDLFVLRATPADYLQPAVVLSGRLVTLGVAPWLALMVWKPVAVLAYVLAARALVSRGLTRSFDRRAALVLALFYASLSIVFGRLAVLGDMVGLWQAWGYPWGLIGVGLITFGLLGYVRARDDGRVTPVPGLLGALAGTVHPWQGEQMVAMIVLAELVSLRGGPAGLGGWRAPRARLAALTLGLVAVPLVYYLGLGHVDPVWRLGQAHARHAFSTDAALIGAAPLLAVALLGYRGSSADFLERLLRAWVPAVVLLWLFATTALGATPQHAVNGLAFPLSVLAVRGVRRAGLDRLPHARALACLAVLLVTVPATAWAMIDTHTYTRVGANFITGGEDRALQWLAADLRPGGVLSTFRLGAAIPGLTGRRVYVGDCIWSQPHCPARRALTERLFAGGMSAATARRFVRGTGARFLIGGCDQPRRAVTTELAGLIVATHRFGCARVWQLRAMAH